jgi:hypothetical protein
LGVLTLDQIDFPLPMPALELLFAGNGRVHVLKKFKANEMMDRILLGEAVNRVGAMLVEARDQIGRDSDVEGAVVTAGEDVDAGLLHKHRTCEGMDAETSSA